MRVGHVVKPNCMTARITKHDEIELLESSKETNRCDDSDGDEGSSKLLWKILLLYTSLLLLA